MTCPCEVKRSRARRRYRGPLVIRAPYPEGPFFDVEKSFDADRAARRRRQREEAWRRSWRGRVQRAANLIRGVI